MKPVRIGVQLAPATATWLCQPRTDVPLRARSAPDVGPEVGPDVIHDKFGIRNIVCVVEGPDWDLGLLCELLA